MSDYIPTPVPEAEQFRRYSQAQLRRSYAEGVGSQVVYREEHVVRGPAGEMTQGAGELAQTITDKNENTEFSILGPAETGLITTGGIMTYGELIQALDSFYYHLAALRDKEQDTDPKGHRRRVDKSL